MHTVTTQLLEQKIRKAFTRLGLTTTLPFVVQGAVRVEFGDYQVNGIMAIAKSLGVNARDLAAKIIEQINAPEIVAHLSVAGPGFINIKLADTYLNNNLTTALLQVKATTPQKVVIDYSSPNLAKEMHVGHLRSTIIGDALVRLYEFLGHTVIRRNHVGDWGTQFGMLTAHLLEVSQNGGDTKLALNDLEEFYRQAKTRFDTDPAFAERARAYVVKLHAGDKEALGLWQQFVEISLAHCQEIYERLHVKLQVKDAVSESAYNELLPKIVADLVAKGVAVCDQGAKCVFFTKEELALEETTPFIVQKKDGAYLYATTDIAALYERVTELQAKHLIYVIDTRQTLHLKQLFATAQKAHFVNKTIKLEHVAFGTMLGEDHKPFKTRAGGTVKLMALLDEAVSRGSTIIKERNPTWSSAQINKVAEVLGIAAVKYADLAKNRVSDYMFSFDQMLAFEGNTAPYMLYAYVRICSIFRKLELELAAYLDQPITITENEERCLALHLIRFPEYLLQATHDNYPHYICTYLYTLAGLFMRFYEACPIAQADTQTIKQSRLALAALTAKVLQVGLGLLGIEVVTQM